MIKEKSDLAIGMLATGFVGWLVFAVGVIISFLDDETLLMLAGGLGAVLFAGSASS